MFNEHMKLVLTLIDSTLGATYLLYLFSGIALRITKELGAHRWRRVPNLIWFFCKWPAFVWLLFGPVHQIVVEHQADGWYWATEFLNVMNWWWYRDAGDDDEWKNLKKKLKLKVAQLGGKLVIVPETA